MRNKKQETPEFKVGDRVRVIGRKADTWLQKRNRIGTVKGKAARDPMIYLKMDKPAERDAWEHPGIIVRRGYCYCAWPDELEKIK